MIRAVVDSCVVVATFVSEEATEDCDRLLSLLSSGSLALFAPMLLDLEVGYALARYVRRKVISTEVANEAYGLLLDLDLKRIAATPLTAQAYADAPQYGMGTYDAIYVDLARRLKLPLITADQRLLDKLPPDVRGYSPAGAVAALPSGNQ